MAQPTTLSHVGSTSDIRHNERTALRIPSVSARTLTAMFPEFQDDDAPRRPDVRKKIVAAVLILCLVAGVAPFLAALIF